MTDGNHGQAMSPPASPGDRFEWHPVYAGKTHAQVLKDLTDEIARDQRAYKLAIDGAEASEHDSLVTVVELERRWSEFEFDWCEMDAGQLANRILRFELERERQQQSFPFADYRASGALLDTGEAAAPSGGGNIPVVKIGVALLAVLLVILLLVIVF